MTTVPVEEMSAELDELIRQVPGVATLYRSGPLAARVVAAGREAVRADRSEPMVVVDRDGDRTTVEATIGVDSRSAAETCRAVYDAVSAWSKTAGPTEVAVRITVAQAAD